MTYTEFKKRLTLNLGFKYKQDHSTTYKSFYKYIPTKGHLAVTYWFDPDSARNIQISFGGKDLYSCENFEEALDKVETHLDELTKTLSMKTVQITVTYNEVNSEYYYGHDQLISMLFDINKEGDPLTIKGMVRSVVIADE